MWNAIKSDLFDFVSTIKEDTTKTVIKAIGNDEEEEDKSSIEQATTDLRRSFSTYNSPVEKKYSKEFEKFSKGFALSSYNVDIASLLDLEHDVSRYYAELVPAQIRPELFWARYFFKLQLLSRNSSLSDLEDDEEDLTWDLDADPTTVPSTTAEDNADFGRVQDNIPFDSSTLSTALRVQADAGEEELNRLRGNVRTLTRRVTELEAQIAEKDRALASALQQLSSYNAVVPAMMNAAASVPASVINSSNVPTTTNITDNNELPVETDDKPIAQSMSYTASHVVRREDSMSSFCESECSDGSSIVLVSSSLPPSVPVTTKTAATSSKVISLDESDDDDGGWT